MLKLRNIFIVIGGIVILVVGFGVYFFIRVNNIVIPSPNPKKYQVKLHYPSTNESDKFSKALIARGEHLAKIGDCISCHTGENPGSVPFAGGLVMRTPFGNVITPNITPNRTEGIGSWSEKDFSRAVHEGVSPSGSYYYPAFPYIFFNKLTKKDTKALYAYFQSIPPNDRRIPKNNTTFVWPASIRFTQLGWRLVFFQFQKTGPYKNDPTKSEDWNRGAYYVQGLGHCAMCHSPAYNMFSKKFPLAAPNTHKNFQGSFVEGYLAPNISGSSSSRLYTAQVQDMMKVFRDNQMVGGGDILGPMMQVNNNGLYSLSDKDIKSIFVYLKSINTSPPPKVTKTANKKSAQGSSAPIDVKALYKTHCSICHNTGAGGAPKLGNKKDWAPILKKDQATVLKNALHGIKAMPAKGGWGTGSDAQIKAIVDYMIKEGS